MARSSSPLDFLYQALSEPLGIVLTCLDGDRLHWRTKLYQARTAAGDPALASLQIRYSPVDENELWLVRTNKGANTSDG